MKFIKATISIIALIAFFGVVKAQQTIDSAKSTVNFTINNFGVGVDGTLSELSGKVNFDAADLTNSMFEVKIPVKTINTETPKRDAHLQEEEFFDATKHPFIEFVSTSVVKMDQGFEIEGKMTIKGVTRSEKIAFKLEGGVYVGSLIIDRQNYKVGGSGMLDTIGDDVTINIHCVVK
jgi:polyisoprenoid-binding protein YceI